MYVCVFKEAEKESSSGLLSKYPNGWSSARARVGSTYVTGTQILDRKPRVPPSQYALAGSWRQELNPGTTIRAILTRILTTKLTFTATRDLY